MKKNRLTQIIAVVAGAVIVIWLFQRLNVLPTFKDIFAEKPVVIDQTPILIKEIKTIAQLVTITTFDEVVVDSLVFTKASAFTRLFNQMAPLPLLPRLEKQLVLIAKGKVLAGIDLQKLQAEDFEIKQDTITLHLPKSQLLDVIVNPADIETFEETGTWTYAAVTQVKIKAKTALTQRAIARGILQKADVKAKAVMENFLRTAGYSVVYLR